MVQIAHVECIALDESFAGFYDVAHEPIGQTGESREVARITDCSIGPSWQDKLPQGNFEMSSPSITHTTDGPDDFRVGAILFDLFAQQEDVLIKGT